jgi:hypothetical protein
LPLSSKNQALSSSGIEQPSGTSFLERVRKASAILDDGSSDPVAVLIAFSF